MAIYKFRGLDNEKKKLSQYTLDILNKGELFLSKPSAFNDVFDTRVVFKSVMGQSIDEIKKYFKSLANLYPNDPLFSKEKMKTIADSISDERSRETVCTAIEQMLQQVALNKTDFFRVFCFSKKWNTPSMWGYYADNCRGVAIGFKTVEYQKTQCIEAENYTLNTCPPSIFSKFQTCNKVFVPLYDIKYTDNAPNMPDLISHDTSSIKDWLTTKGTCWAHEAEIRMLVCPSWMKLMDPSKVVVYVKDFVINEIIVGVDTPTEAEEQIRNIVSDPYSKAYRATVYRLVPKADNYGFDRIPV